MNANLTTDSPAACTCAAVRKASRAVTQAFSDALRPCGLRATQFTLLATLAGKGEMSITALGDEMVLDRTTLTRNLKLLQTAGLVDIWPGADRRERVAGLTDQGRQVLDQALPKWKEAQTRMINGLGRDRWEQLMANLEATVEISQQ